MPLERRSGCRQPLRQRALLLFGRGPAFLSLRNLTERIPLLPLDLEQAFFVELNAALVVLDLVAELEALLLELTDLMLERAQLFAELRELILIAQHPFRAFLVFTSQLFQRHLLLEPLGLEHVELMPGQLGIELLQFEGKLLVTPRLARLTLQRADLAFDLPDEITHAQEILIRILELAQRLAFLRLELGDARRLLEHQAPILGSTRENLRDVPLRHDAVAGAPHPRAHEQLLDVLQPAGRSVDEILAAAISEHPPRHRHFVVGQLHPGRLQMILLHVADGQRHLRHPQRLPMVGPVEDHVGHLPTPQGLGGLLP